MENNELRQEITKLENNVNHFRKNLDDLDQYGWRDSIENNGVPNKSGEGTEKITINMQLIGDLGFGLISLCHANCCVIVSSPKEHAAL